MSKLESLDSQLFRAMSTTETSLVHGGKPVIIRTYDVGSDGTISGPTPDLVNLP